jgi:hypothetical protein
MLTEAERQERKKRLLAFTLRERGGRILVILTAALVVGLLFWWQGRSPIDPLDRQAIASFCKADYAKARSASDSAMIDQRSPIVGRRTAAAHITCGQLRLTGGLH